MAPRKLTPPVLGADASQKAVAALRKHLSAQLSPVLCVEDAALAARCRAMASRESALHASQPDARQEAFPLDGPDWSQLREDLTALAERTLRRLAPDVPRLPLDARLCLRRYPPGHTGQRLGAHVDDTLCTLLWASTPGLEILAPQDDAAWNGADVAKVGLPTMGPPPKVVQEDDWATVTPPSADCFLFTPGNGWSGIVTSVPLRSPTLHRVAVGGDVERLSLPLLVSVRGDYGSALNSVGEALRQISLDGAAKAAEDRLSPLTEVLGVELLQHLDAESLCRLNMCARFFGEEHATTRRSRCEDAARERALDLMQGHVTGLCVLEGVSSVRQLGQQVFRAFLVAFYKSLAREQCRTFPYLPDGRRIPKGRWPKWRQDFQGWFHTLDAFEAGPVAAYAAAEALRGLAMAVTGGSPPQAVLDAAREAADRALLARPGELRVWVDTRRDLPHDDGRIAALVAGQGGRWERNYDSDDYSDDSYDTMFFGTATFPSLRHAVEVKDALRADEAVECLSVQYLDWERLNYLLS
ncbi:unnamed protein product [Pelagomonas calceolata]|uniref:Fe2OG dioxygenase domain-containing protein n=1 Tax=Pelagomonas calceolata TaxID=35677 RepID=A0A7S4A6U3_9STRA|nr:unnamed protein product [Pelagomonas calceolata]